MQESYDEFLKLLGLMNLKDEVPVYKGAKRAMPDEQTPVMSEGAELIIREALSDDPKSLYVIFLGPVTDLAAAYLKEPSIAGKLTAVWVGGGAWPNGEEEFNLGLAERVAFYGITGKRNPRVDQSHCKKGKKRTRSLFSRFMTSNCSPITISLVV